MIEIIMSGMCENCTIAKLQLQYTVDKRPDGIHREYWLGCEYEQVCKKWNRKGADDESINSLRRIAKSMYGFS